MDCGWVSSELILKLRQSKSLPESLCTNLDLINFRNVEVFFSRIFILFAETLAQELELERKSRQQQVERDVKSPLQDRSAYYKNSVLFTSSAT